MRAIAQRFELPIPDEKTIAGALEGNDENADGKLTFEEIKPIIT